MIDFDILNKEITSLLIKNELLDVLIKKELLNEEISKILISEKEEHEIKKMICEKEKIQNDKEFHDWLEKKNTNQQDFYRNISIPLRLNRLCMDKFSKKAETRFISKKDELGTVTYNLVRVKDFFQAQELYLRIQEDPLCFGSLAKTYSLGPEKDTQGVVGPAPLNQGHPGLLRELKVAKTGELIQPFKIEDFWVIIRLESRLEAKLDENMQLILSKEIFDEYLTEKTTEKVSELKTKLNIN